MSMSLRSGTVVLGAAAALWLGTLSLVAQEAPATKAAPGAAKAKRANGRVPAYFGEIGLTPEQRESIYKIRAKHQAKIADLQKQLAAVRQEELAECETVLSATQKELLAARRKAADEKKGSAKKGAAETKPGGDQPKPAN